MSDRPEIGSDSLGNSQEIVENSDTTAKAGKNIKELRKKCMKLVEAGTLLAFYRNLRKKGIGTHPVESRARKFLVEKKSKEGGDAKEILKNKSIVQRDPEVVRKLLDIKIQAVTEFKADAEKEYNKECREFEKVWKQGSRNWRKKYSEIKEVMNEVWKKETERYKEKTSKL